MHEFIWKTWGGSKARLDKVDKVVFNPEHVVFYDSYGRILLAARNSDINDLKEVFDGDPPF
jgi:hypothetical protein